MKPLLIVSSLILLAACLHAETTPLTQPLPEATEIPITCELTKAPRHTDVPVFGSQKEADNSVGTYHYRLWLPTGYSSDATKKWPCLFVMSASGKASLGSMREYLTAKGYVVVLLDDAKNGPWEPIVGNFLAAHDDVIQRVRIADGKKYATGQSGGARASSVFVQLRPGFGGLILQAAGPSQNGGTYNISGIKRNAPLKIAMTMGNSDQNKGEVDQMQALFNKQKLAVFPFEGGHMWAPADVFAKAMDWVSDGKSSSANSPNAPVGKGDSFDIFKKP